MISTQILGGSGCDDPDSVDKPWKPPAKKIQKDQENQAAWGKQKDVKRRRKP
jgi:hypothetical protein